MKTAAMNRSSYVSQPNLPYPNAATRRELVKKFLDLLLVAAMGAGAAAMFLLIMVLA